jgi:integrase
VRCSAQRWQGHPRYVALLVALCRLSYKSLGLLISLRSFKPLLEEAELPDIRFHDLRHTFASIALSKGANINAVSKMLGHSSVRITLDVYGHLMPGMQEATLNTLDGVFS